MGITFKQATKRESKLRMALVGPSGSGKTYTALSIATALVGPEGRIAVLDTEHGSASKYADLFRFDVVELDSFAPESYIEVILAAQDGGYDALIIDSLSHEWNGKGGALEIHDVLTARSKSSNSYMTWADVTPRHNALIETMIAARLHLITTMRSKSEYVLELDANGKTKPRKVGMAPIQREGMDYEMDVVGELDADNTLVITKTRCAALNGQVFQKAGAKLAGVLAEWLTDGAPLDPEQAAKLADLRAEIERQIAPKTTRPTGAPAVDSSWARDNAQAEGFFKWAEQRGLTRAEALKAIGVDDITTYADNRNAARTAVSDYIRQHVDTKSEPEPEGEPA